MIYENMLDFFSTLFNISVRIGNPLEQVKMNISISTLIIFGTVFLMGAHVLARTLETGSPEDAGRLLFFLETELGKIKEKP